MKTRSFIYLFAAILISGSIAFTGCKKQKTAKNEDAQTSQDNQAVQGHADAAMNDANVAIGDYPNLTGKGNTPNYPAILTFSNTCGATLDASQVNNGILKINYTGATCNNQTRTGSVLLTIVDYSVSIFKRWRVAGCVLKIDFLDYKVTKASNGKSVTLNGTMYATNVLGGTFGHIFLNLQPNLVHTITGEGLQVTFDDTKTATWNISRKYTYTYSSLVFTCKGEGTGSHNGIDGLENWGTTRDGDEFTSQVNSPIVWNTTCGAWAPLSGEVTLKAESKDFYLHAVFGVDASGNAATPSPCTYGYKVDWKYKNKAYKKVIAY